MKREVLDAMDHRFLNKEVPEFVTQIPTTENIASAVWQRLESKRQQAQRGPAPRPVPAQDCVRFRLRSSARAALWTRR